MALFTRPIGAGSASRFPWVPTVARGASGRWEILAAEIEARYRHLVAEGINSFTMKVARASLAEVPRGPRGHDELGGPNELADSIHHPENDPSFQATPGLLWAEISYDAPYAHVQHEGLAIMQHEHPIIPARAGFFFERTDQLKGITVDWVVRHHTTPGTKDHFLSDPEKALAPTMESYVGTYVRERLGA